MSRLIVFLSLYFSIYGAAHLYLLIKWRRAFYLQGIEYFLLFVVLTFLLLAPINARMLDSQGYMLASLAMSWIGFLWMGFIFIYVCLALPLDGYHLLVGAGQRLTDTDWTGLMLSRRQSVGLVAILTLGLMAYGAVEAYRIRVETLTIQSRLPSTTPRVRIVQISDVHLGPMLYPGRLAPIIKAIEQAQHDILVSSGDLIDGPLLSPSSTAAAFSNLTAPLGKYAVTGNHEFYCGIDRASEFIKEAGFTLLRNRTVTVGKRFTITGIDDPSGGRSAEEEPTEAQLAAGLPQNRFALLLKHRPQIDPDTKGAFDLQLSGHTHQGQIFPFGLIIRLFYPWDHGWHPIGDHGGLYTSRGTGTWGPPIRILAPPEITVIDIVPKKQ
ncbi:MAG: metallophosphoesterase [Desulfobacteraceae bacterium]